MQNWAMRWHHLRRSLKNNTNKISSSLGNAGWSWYKGIVILVAVVVTVTVGFDIYFSVDEAIENYELLSRQREKLSEVENLSNELDEELEYFSSLEYRQRYAYDSLNLARSDEYLYYIETDDRADYNAESTNPDPIQKNEKKLWWKIFADLIT